MNPNVPGGGGYGGPPPGGYGGPPGGGGGGYGGPPGGGGGGYGGPPGGGGGGYGGPPGGGGYGPPPGGGGYGPPPGGGFGAPPGGFGGPPAYGAFGAPGFGSQGGPSAELSSKITLWMILSFLSLICGCSIFCVIPIIFAFLAKSANDSGNHAEAASKIQISKVFCFIGYAIMLLSVLLQVAMAVAR